jgi:iron complex transport system substrate-binding protein
MIARSLILGATLLVLVAGCGVPQREPGGTRVVSLVPSATEVIYALGAEERLVGTTTFCDYPEAAKHTYKVGDFANPDIERIRALRPSLVILTLPVHQLIAEKLEEAGTRVYVSRPVGIEGILTEIESLGHRLGKPGAARELADSLRRELSELPEYPDSPRVYVEISSSPLVSVGQATFLDEVVGHACGRNIYAGSSQEYPLVDQEFVVTQDPEVIILLHPGPGEDVRMRLGWQGIAAVRQGRVITDLDENLVSRPGPRFVRAIRTLGSRLHR